MPGCSKAKNPRNVEISFEESDHKYTSIIDGKTIEYVSGTTFVSSFFPKFDPTGEITKRCAEREGLTESQMREKWREKANRSCVYGTKIHECMEDRLQGHPLRNKPSDDREKLVFKVTENLAKKVLEKADIEGIEKIIFDERLKIAGTMDLFLKSKKDGKFWIVDWKTNERIDTVNKYHNFGLEPIKHVPAINYHEYAMQLNLYEYLLKYGGYIGKDDQVGKVLFHITETGAKSYPLPNYQKEIGDMMEAWKRNGNMLLG